MCQMEFSDLRKELDQIDDPRAVSVVSQLKASLDRMIDIGLPYLFMNRESATLSGGEAQRLKLVRYMGSSLCGMIYIFDEPSTGMHPRDVHRMTRLLENLRDKGNTVLVVEHDKDIISIADEVIDIGPLAGKNGGLVLTFQLATIPSKQSTIGERYTFPAGIENSVMSVSTFSLGFSE